MNSIEIALPKSQFAQGIDMANSGRLLSAVEVDKSLIEKMLNLLKLSAAGEITIPENGRIASNVCVYTKDHGKIMLRFYPPGYDSDKLETGNVDFEIETLHYLSQHGIPVPKPLEFPDSSYKWNENGIKVFAYSLLSGNALEISDFSTTLATRCGTLLKDMIYVSEKFQSAESAPGGDLEYFLKIYEAQVNRYPLLKTSEELKMMVAFTEALISDNRLRLTPKGIVHADFFFENILRDEFDQLKIIDFGDAYYGHVIMDIAIGAMEFSVLDDGSWDMDFFKNFIAPHADWLKQHNITPDLFYSIITANCLRFAIYTMPNTLEENLLVKENPYVLRFLQLMVPDFRNKVESTYAQSIE